MNLSSEVNSAALIEFRSMPETDYSFERRLVFQLRLKDFARKHKSLRHLGTFYARQINRLPILFFGKIVVDDVRDVLHVNPARSQVRRHQHAVAPLLESRQRRSALRLRAVAMNHGRGESLAI